MALLAQIRFIAAPLAAAVVLTAAFVVAEAFVAAFWTPFTEAWNWRL